MTKQPWTISRTMSLGEAHRMMHEHEIRHLPVVDDGELVGIVSERDLHILEAMADTLVAVPVERVMRDHPFVVTSDTAIDDVAQLMAAGKYGSAIIVGHDGVEGIFTTVDACRALADVLGQAAAESLRADDFQTHT